MEEEPGKAAHPFELSLCDVEGDAWRKLAQPLRCDCARPPFVSSEWPPARHVLSSMPHMACLAMARSTLAGRTGQKKVYDAFPSAVAKTVAKKTTSVVSIA